MTGRNLKLNNQERAYGLNQSSQLRSDTAPGASRTAPQRMSNDAISRLNKAPEANDDINVTTMPEFLDKDSLEKAQGRGRNLKKTADIVKDVTAKAIGGPLGTGAKQVGKVLGDSVNDAKTGTKRLWLITLGLVGFGLMAIKSGMEFISNLFSKKVPSVFKGLEFGGFAVIASQLYKTLTGGDGFRSMTGLSGVSALAFVPWLMNKAYEGKVKAINHLDKLNNGETSGAIKSMMNVLSSPIKAIMGIKKEPFRGDFN